MNNVIEFKLRPRLKKITHDNIDTVKIWMTNG